MSAVRAAFIAALQAGLSTAEATKIGNARGRPVVAPPLPAPPAAPSAVEEEEVDTGDMITEAIIMAMDKSEVLDFLRAQGAEPDGRFGVDKLRAEAIALMFGDDDEEDAPDA